MCNYKNITNFKDKNVIKTLIIILSNCVIKNNESFKTNFSIYM